MELLVPLVTVMVLLVVGGGIGAVRERNHLRELDAAERLHATFPVTDTRTFLGMDEGADVGVLVMGAVVISTDYLKSFLAGLRNLVGGELRSYQTLLSRARREAKRRMVDDARARHASAVVNVRFETSMIDTGGRSTSTSIEVLCYGTAILRRDGSRAA